MKHLLTKSYSILIATALATAVFSYNANAGSKGELSIAEIVIANPDIDNDGEGDFDTLLDAVILAGPSVLDRLSSNGQNTVFAPTDAAFDAAFAELATLGIAPEDVLTNTELLTLILNYHVSPGYRNSKKVLKAKTIRMRDGGFLQQSGGVVTDNLERTATIIAIDIPAANGTIHVIDNVVLPALP